MVNHSFDCLIALQNEPDTIPVGIDFASECDERATLAVILDKAGDSLQDTGFIWQP